MKKLILILAIISFLALPLKVEALTSQEVEPYIWQKQVVKNISPAADDLRAELSKQVNKMIAAGHLAPLRIVANEGRIIYLWFHAGDPIYALSEALKYLPANDTATKTALTNYLKSEITNYPPYVGTMVFNRAPWLNPSQGTRREYYPLNPSENLFYYTDNQTLPVVQTFYHIWSYADATGDKQLIINNWDRINSLYNTLRNRDTTDWKDKGGCIAKYGDISGCVGMARLAHLVNNASVRDDAASRATQGYNNGLNFTQFEETALVENSYFKIDGGDDGDPTANLMYSYTFMNLVPEVGRFIGQYVKSAAEASINKQVQNIPTWYVTLSPGFVGGEVNYITPLTGHPLFQAHSMILRKDANFLRQRLDVPLAKVGDLYYIQNLVSTIKAYGQTCWEDIRTGTQNCEPSTSTSSSSSSSTSTSTTTTTPTTCATDLNNDRFMDLADYNILSNDYFESNPTNPRSDIDKSGLVDLEDFSLLARAFFQNCP